MKKIKILILLIFFGKVEIKAQLSCMTPPTLSLGVYDASSWAPISPVITCTYVNAINISPVNWLVGNPFSQGTTPCLLFITGPTNANSQTNNTMTIYQGTNAASALSLCSSPPCFTFIPNNSTYSLYFGYVTPSLQTVYNMCNINPAASFNYTIKNCYSANGFNLATGIWNNSNPNSCQSVTIPANSPIGISGYTVSPAVPPTASATTGNGDLFLDAGQMSAGIYTITYFFNSQGVPTSCTASASRTIQITNPYNASWNQPVSQCTSNPCLSLPPFVTGTPGGTFVGTGVTSNSFCPSFVAPGNYTVTYTVGLTPQCGANQTRTITVAPTPVANAGPTKSITCVANPTILNGSGGGTYSWSNTALGNNFSTNQNPTVSVAGIYSLTVNNGTCTSPVATTQVVLNTTPPSLPNVVVSNTLNCYNNTATLNSTGSNITYTWSGPGIVSGAGSASPIVNQPGTYNYTVTSTINGCTSSSFVSVSQNTAIAYSTSSNGTITCINNQATITANPSGYTYTWSPPSGGSILTGQFTPTIQVSGGGSYSVVATNPVNGCTLGQLVSLPVNTTQPNAIINNTPVLNCFNPQVTLNGAPGSGVTYTWNGPGIVGSPNNSTVQVNAPGVYSLTVTNISNGCVDPTPATVNITQNVSTPVISAATQTANLVCGATSTILSGTATPAGSTYTWTSSGGSFLSGVNSSTVSVGTATTYTLISTHPVSGCTSALVYTVIPDVNTPTVTLISSSGTITCNQTAVTTTASSNPSTGVTYTWSGPGISGPANTSVVSATLAGTYNLTVTNTGNNCQTVMSYVVSANNSPVTPNAVSSSSINCIVNSSTLSASPTPTAAVFNYTWNGPGVSGQTTPTVAVSPTSTAVYTVTVQNPANGCTGTQTVQVVANTNAPSGVNVNPNNVVLACPSQTAVLTATASGSGNTYQWTAPTGGNILSGSANQTVLVTAGSTVVFSVTITGANGCTAMTTATVSPNTNAPQFNFSTNNPSITCQTSSPTVSVNLTSTVAIQSYSWGPATGISGPNNLSFATFTQSGIYTVVVTATNGCITSNTIQVGTYTNSPQFTGGTGTAQPITCTQSTSIINPNYTNPTSELTFTWSGGGITGSANQPSVTVNQAGVYTVQITNTLTGCSSGVLTVQVNGNNVPPTLTISTTSTLGISCLPGGNTVQLTANASATNVTYNWSNGGNTQQITVNTPGVYTVTVTELTGNCSTTQTVSVAGATVLPSPSINPTGALPCGGGTTVINASGPSNYVYNWSGTGIVGSNTLSAITVSAGGVYSVQVTDSNNGCSASYTISITELTVAAQFTAEPKTGSAPLAVTFTNLSGGAMNYTWNFGGTGSSNLTNPTHTFENPGSYTVTLTAMNGTCVSTYTMEIKVTDALFVPELVTPNGDLKNDIWFIKGLDAYPDNKVEIYNRWGNLVYKADPYKNDWDGKPNVQAMGTDRLPVGTYFYILYLNDKDNTVKKGFLKLEY